MYIIKGMLFLVQIQNRILSAYFFETRPAFSLLEFLLSIFAEKSKSTKKIKK